MIENLKKGILLKIGDTLETLQLRLTLNKETIINEENISPTLKEAIDFYKKHHSTKSTSKSSNSRM
jgi:hypothetical protein